MQASDDQMVAQPPARILVVDDEVELLTALCEMLEEHGFDTLARGSGAEALSVLHEHEVDLLITDLMMPGMDGITLLRQAQEIHPYLVSIVATGHGTIETAVNAMRVGAFDYVLKPFRLSGLLPILARALDVGRLKRDNLQLREMVAIHELSQAVALTPDRTSILRKVADAALEQSQADGVAVLVPTPSADTLTVAAVAGSYLPELIGTHAPLDVPLADRLNGRQASDDLVVSGAVSASAARHRLAADQSGTFPGITSLPMLVGGKLVGMLTISVERRQRGLTAGQLKALTILTGTAAAALESASLNEQVRAEERARLLALERAARAEAEVERTARLAAEEAVALRDEFLSVAAHELKTPLTGLHGAVQLMLRQHERGVAGGLEQTYRTLQIIERQTTRLGRLVNQLLETSRLDGGRSALDRGVVDLTALVGSVVEAARASTSQHEIVLSAPAAVAVRVDALSIEQVVGNLVDNAIKFSPDGGRIDIKLQLLDGELVRLSIRDRGIGIPAERRHQIFQRYAQAHADSYRSGLGLGLYISRRLVELHGGQISVETPPDAGTRFVVLLPASPETVSSG